MAYNFINQTHCCKYTSLYLRASILPWPDLAYNFINQTQSCKYTSLYLRASILPWPDLAYSFINQTITAVNTHLSTFGHRFYRDPTWHIILLTKHCCKYTSLYLRASILPWPDLAYNFINQTITAVNTHLSTFGHRFYRDPTWHIILLTKLSLL